MKTVERLFDGPLDVVGDVHGQYDALQDLLGKLNYAPDGSHPDGRRLVFVGDLVDRGPDSPAVAEQVMNMVHAGNAQCVLGNHELNIVRNAEKLDNGWFFGHSTSHGQKAATDGQKKRIKKFFKSLPLALERDDLRVVHACWNKTAIQNLPRWFKFARNARSEYRRFRRKTNKKLAKNGFAELYGKEKTEFDDLVRFDNKDPDSHWPGAKLLPGYAMVNEARQMENPIGVLTSGEERAAKKTYPAGGKFRFVNRVPWWNNYHDKQAVIIGHYWRLYDFGIVERPRAAGIDVFKDTGPDEWLGARKNVYCVDFSVGARGSKFSSDVCRLAAVRWPEATVMFDNGEEIESRFGLRACSLDGQRGDFPRRPSKRASTITNRNNGFVVPPPPSSICGATTLTEPEALLLDGFASASADERLIATSFNPVDMAVAVMLRVELD